MLECRHLFATPLIVAAVPLESGERSAIVEDILQWTVVDPVKNRIRNRDTLQALDRPAFAPLVSALAETVRQVDEGLEITTLWPSLAYRGATHWPHHHVGAAWCGIYYLAMPEGSPPTVFLDPRGPAPHVLGLGMADRYELLGEEGWVAIFPAYLMHYVDAHEGDDARITVAFNASVRSRG